MCVGGGGVNISFGDNSDPCSPTSVTRYEGEWVDDTPRCGVFSDIPGEFLGVGVARGKAPEDHFSLPEVGAAWGGGEAHVMARAASDGSTSYQ